MLQRYHLKIFAYSILSNNVHLYKDQLKINIIVFIDDKTRACNSLVIIRTKLRTRDKFALLKISLRT